MYQTKKIDYENCPLFVQYGIENYSQLRNNRKQSLPVKLFIAENLKTVANKKFKEKEYSTAISRYSQALNIFRFGHVDFKTRQGEFYDILPKTPEKLRPKIEALLLSLYLNIAACSLKISGYTHYKNCICSCDEALKLDPKNPKA